MYQKLTFLVAGAILSWNIIEANPAPAKAFTITATDITGLRKFQSSEALLLSFDAVKNASNFEDRTIAHFAIKQLSKTTPFKTILDIPVDNFDEGLPFGTFEIYYFAGDGKVSTDEWNAGTLFQTLTGIDGDKATLSVDVTSLLQNALDNNNDFLSFNFRAGSGTDRYFLSDSVGLPEPTLSLTSQPVREPATVGGSLIACVTAWQIRRMKKKVTYSKQKQDKFLV
ncbi:hypothetical protein LC612_35390 [Nostoc sp. CHAB 5834]|nr:hypothetical protein [Nostoc sp. CHAB 5834]